MTDDVPNDDVYRRLAEVEAALDAARDREASLREYGERYRSLFQRMGQGYCELELVRDETGRAVDQRYIAFNPAFERLFGIPVAEAQGRTASEVFPGLEPWWHEAFDRIARHGRPERIEHEVASLDRAFEVFVYPPERDQPGGESLPGGLKVRGVAEVLAGDGLRHRERVLEWVERRCWLGA